MHNKRLNARELQHALLLVLEKAQRQNATEYGALARIMHQKLAQVA